MNIKDLPPGSYKVITPEVEEPKVQKRSFMQDVGQVGVGLGKSVVKTVKGAADLGEKIFDPAVTALTGIKKRGNATDIIPEKAYTATNPAQKAGQVVGDIAQFALPGGAISKAGKAAQALGGTSKLGKTAGFVGRSAVEGASYGGLSTVQGGDFESGTVAGAAMPLAGKLVGGLGVATKSVAKHLSSNFSGVPEAAIEQAFKNPQAVRQAMVKAAQEGTDLSAQRIRDQAVSALSFLKKSRSEAYEEGLKAVEDSLTRTKAGQLYVKRALNDAEAKALKGYKGGEILVPTDLSLKGVKNVATRVMRQYGLNVSNQGIDIGKSALQKSHVSKLQELVDRVYNWDDFSPTGLNQLRKVMDGYKVGGIKLPSADKQFNAIISKLRSNLASYVGDRVPAVKKLNQEFAVQSKVIDNILDQLKLETNDPNTALRKLLNVFNPKSSVYRPIVKELGEKAGIDLMSDIAGLTMSQWTAQGGGKYIATLFGGAFGGASLLNPAFYPGFIGTATMSSPQLIGRAVTTAGKVAPEAKQTMTRAKQLLKAGVVSQTNDEESDQ